jgi:nucleoside-diphosphate-sugar epimerase
MGFPDAVVYRNNVVGTFHVFDAAAKLGITRVVSASSLSAYGYPFQRVWSEPDYFPLDEAHPLRPQDPYGLSKQAGEQVAQAYARAGSGTAVSLRFSHLVSEQTVPQWRKVMDERPRHAAECLWSHVYDDDVADACLRSLAAGVDGHVALLLTAATTLAPKPTDELLDEYYPSVPRRSGSHSHWSLVDCSLAAETIGWDPR